MNALVRVVRKLRRWHPASAPAPERRVEPRVSRRLKVCVAGVELESTNVTAAGLQLECPAHRLPPLRTAWDPSATRVQITLPDGQAVRAECSVAYVSECDDDFLIGLAFVRLDEDAKGSWQAYLERLEASRREDATAPA